MSAEPAEPTTVYAGRVLTGVREATREAIDPTHYQSIDAGHERYYLVAVARTSDPTTWSHQGTAIYATADGARVTTRRYGEHRTPHAISAPSAAGEYTDRLLEADAEAIAALVARAHGEVER